MRAAPLLCLPALLIACGGGETNDDASATASVEVVAKPDPLAPPPPPLEQPNVVLVTLDTVRADHLGCYGYFRDTTPHLDVLAKESVLFERCMAPMSTTLPSHTSMFTGVWPIEHGVLANIKKAVVYERDERLVSMAEVFKALGYDTAAFVSAFPLRSSTNLAGGFDVYGEPTGAEKELPADHITDEALAWLGQRQDAPFFLWVHYFDPHNPYYQHPETGTFETSDDLREWLGERGITLRAHREMVKRGRDGRLLDALEAANFYDGELRFTDHHLGRLLDELRGRGTWGHTIVAVIGDHGDGLNQHETPGHGYIWNEQLQVPFLMRVPGMAPGRFSDTVSVVDLTATLMARVKVPGHSAFKRQLRGLDALDPAFEVRPIVATTSARKERTDNLDEQSVITNRWKYIRRGAAGMSLYDLLEDPFELHDVSVLFPAVCDDLEATLASELAGQRARSGGRTRAATAEEIEALQALGYGGRGEDDDEDR